MNSLAEIEPLKSFTLAEALNVPPDKIEEVEAKILKMPEAKLAKDYRVDHHFAPGVYYRQIYMPAGDLIIGMQHRTSHLNVILQGSAAVMMDGVMHFIKAPYVVKSEAGVRKILYIQEDMIWATVHPTTETDLVKLEHELIDKSASFKAFEEMNQMKAMIEKGELPSA